MALGSKYVFMASMDVEADKEALFNEVYDTEHVPYLLEVPGVIAVSRVKSEPATVRIGGEAKPLAAASPVYTAIYEIEDPANLSSDGWAEAVERGRWAGEVRPYTSNRRHALYKVL